MEELGDAGWVSAGETPKGSGCGERSSFSLNMSGRKFQSLRPLASRSLVADLLWEHSYLLVFILSQWEDCSFHSDSLVSNGLLINALGGKAHCENNWLPLKGSKDVQNTGRGLKTRWVIYTRT